jgi:hypothetical protein
MGQMQIGQSESAQPTSQMQPHQPEPASVQSQPAAIPQHQQQSVGLPSNFDGTTTHAPLSKSSISNDPSNPPLVPFQKPKSQPKIIAPADQDRLAQELPKSKLLHSNPEPEPRKNDLLRRKDSETQEDDEFHDAES